MSYGDLAAADGIREGIVIPELTGTGLLPVGRHSATIAEIEEVFVGRAPHPAHRGRIFQAFKLYTDIIQDILERGAFWINGGFCTHKQEPPKDLDLAVLIDPSLPLTNKDVDRLVPLFTLQGVQAVPLSAERVQPMGGLIDSFPVNASIPEQGEYWDTLWSSVKGPDGELIVGATKGYLEVSW